MLKPEHYGILKAVWKSNKTVYQKKPKKKQKQLKPNFVHTQKPHEVLQPSRPVILESQKAISPKQEVESDGETSQTGPPNAQ